MTKRRISLSRSNQVQARQPGGKVVQCWFSSRRPPQSWQRAGDGEPGGLGGASMLEVLMLPP